MKKLLAVTLSLLLSVALHAQSDVTRFLGIPVDGPKDEMIRQLKAKGFRSTSYDSDFLEGEFNGAKVNVYVATNKNKVCRIMVCDANSVDETSIRIRFNTLCRQFKNNPRYFSLNDDQTLSDDEDISYEISVHNKRYEAVFYQQSNTSHKEYINECVAILSSKYTKEQLENPSEELKSEMIKLSEDYTTQVVKKLVWFKISDLAGKYYITMFYDNEYNQADGDDL